MGEVVEMESVLQMGQVEVEQVVLEVSSFWFTQLYEEVLQFLRIDERGEPQEL